MVAHGRLVVGPLLRDGRRSSRTICMTSPMASWFSSSGIRRGSLFQLHFSPDGQWLAFQEPLDDSKARMLIAKVDAAGRPGPSTDWIEIARGDSQAWSPMGGILYYDSDRDGSWCIWAQRLDRDTMRPIGPPIALHHATTAAPVDWQRRSNCPRICGVARSRRVQHGRDQQQHLDDRAPGPLTSPLATGAFYMRVGHMRIRIPSGRTPTENVPTTSLVSTSITVTRPA